MAPCMSMLPYRIFEGVTSSRDICFCRDSGVFHWLGRPINWLLYALPSNNSITNANCVVGYEYSGFLREIRVMRFSGS